MKGEKRMELFWSSYSPSGKARVRQSSTEDMGVQPSGPIKRQAQGQSMSPLPKFRQCQILLRSGLINVNFSEVFVVVINDFPQKGIFMQVDDLCGPDLSAHS